MLVLSAVERFFLRAFLVLACCVCVVSCTKRDEVLQFDASDPLATSPSVVWAVVSVPYAACYENSGYNASVTTHYRRGTVLQVLGEETVVLTDSKKLENWYCFSDGWLPESAVQLYTNKLRAETASRALLAQ